jgi:hypothetical protein
MDFTPSADGEYIVKVHDFLFRGGGDYFYRLSVRTGPHIDFVFPPSGMAGTKSKYVLYGRNLPGSKPAGNLAVNGKPLEQLEVEIELVRDPTAQKQVSAPQKIADATLDAFEYRLRTPRGISNPVLIGYTSGPVVAEQEPNDQPAQAQNISPPCEYVGQFYPKGDRDWLTFEAKKGDAFWVEVFSQRMGLPTDPFVLIQRIGKNDKGEEQISDVKELNDSDSEIGGVEYKTGTRDPSGRFEAEETGVYRILVRDFFNGSEADPRLVYRLSVRKMTPDFQLVAVPQTPPPKKDSKEAFVWTSLLRRGETMPIKVMAFRRDGFNGNIDLKVEDLPAGVTFSETTVEKDKSSAILLITAADTAQGWVGPLKIMGKAKIGNGQVSREARGATLNWDVSDYGVAAIQSRLTRDFILALSGVESAPVSIEPGESKPWEIIEKGKINIPIKITRRADFNGALKLKAVGIGALDKMKEIDVAEKATNVTVQLDLAEYKIPAGTHSFHLQTQTSGKYRNNPEAAKAADEALKEAEKLVTELTAALKKAPELKQEATKRAAESADKAKAASDAAAAASKAAAETEVLVKTATEKLASAKVALEAKSDDQELIAAKDAAVKTVEEVQSKSKAALESKAHAEKALTEAQAKAKIDADAKATAEKAEAEAPARLKDAEKKKELAATRAKETAKIAEPRDVTVTVYSAPINLKIISASK